MNADGRGYGNLGFMRKPGKHEKGVKGSRGKGNRGREVFGINGDGQDHGYLMADLYAIALPAIIIR